MAKKALPYEVTLHLVADWNTASGMDELDPLILALFGEEWEEEAAVGSEETPQPDE
jgi:hypothetical protein